MALISVATDRRKAALEQWQGLGGASACALAKSGISFPAGKMAEGRVAALGELVRALRRQAREGDVSVAQERDIASSIRNEWVEKLQASNPAELSKDWRAYLTGGADELDEILQLLN
ncbi:MULTISPECIES: hypothetical protein [unclassified Corynebacterium]|uniref:hypothetical protein n=1 Tax=unclassified Corynebacterium TaxID=2624378 RepID=UPI0030B69FD6